MPYDIGNGRCAACGATIPATDYTCKRCAPPPTEAIPHPEALIRSPWRLDGNQRVAAPERTTHDQLEVEVVKLQGELIRLENKVLALTTLVTSQQGLIVQLQGDVDRLLGQTPPHTP